MTSLSRIPRPRAPVGCRIDVIVRIRRAKPMTPNGWTCQSRSFSVRPDHELSDAETTPFLEEILSKIEALTQK